LTGTWQIGKLHFLLPYGIHLVRLHPRNVNKKQFIVSGLTLRGRAVRREAAEGFFALYAGRVHTARHGVQDGKKARWVVGRSLTLVSLPEFIMIVPSRNENKHRRRRFPIWASEGVFAIFGFPFNGP